MSPTSIFLEDTMLIRIRLAIKIMMVKIKARHKYRTTFCGILYVFNLCLPIDFLLNIGRFEEYEPDVSRDEMGEE